MHICLAICLYPPPIPEDLFTKLYGGTCFSKIDAANVYLQMEVDEESKNLLTANTQRVYINLIVFLLGSRQVQQYSNNSFLNCSDQGA